MNKERKVDSYGINKNTYQMLFGDQNLPLEESGSIDNLLAYITIDKFTMLKEKNVFRNLLKIIYKNKYNIDLENINFLKETNCYEYRNGDKVFYFSKLSNQIDDIKLKQELMSKKRYGDCHLDAIRLALGINNSKVLTGYITLGSKNYLHSVVEYEFLNQVMILDWTRNLRMFEKDYLELTKFVTLSRVLIRDIVTDMDLLSDKLTIGLKAYLIFHDEIIKYLKRNPLFKLNKEINSLEILESQDLENRQVR